MGWDGMGRMRRSAAPRMDAAPASEGYVKVGRARWDALEAIALLAMHRAVQALYLFLARDAQTPARQQLQQEVRRGKGVGEGDGDGQHLHAELREIAEEQAVRSRAVDSFLREDARQDGARHAAHAMRRPDIQRVVNARL